MAPSSAHEVFGAAGRAAVLRFAGASLRPCPEIVTIGAGSDLNLVTGPGRGPGRTGGGRHRGAGTAGRSSEPRPKAAANSPAMRLGQGCAWRTLGHGAHPVLSRRAGGEFGRSGSPWPRGREGERAERGGRQGGEFELYPFAVDECLPAPGRAGRNGLAGSRSPTGTATPATRAASSGWRGASPAAALRSRRRCGTAAAGHRGRHLHPKIQGQRPRHGCRPSSFGGPPESRRRRRGMLPGYSPAPDCAGVRPSVNSMAARWRSCQSLLRKLPRTPPRVPSGSSCSAPNVPMTRAGNSLVNG